MKKRKSYNRQKMQKVIIECPVYVYRNGSVFFTKHLRVNDGLRLIGGMISDYQSESTHKITQIRNIMSNRVSITCSDGKWNTTIHLEYLYNMHLYSLMEQSKNKAFQAKLIKERQYYVDAIESLKNQGRRVPNVIDLRIDVLSAEIFKMHLAIESHERYFNEIQTSVG